MYTKTNYKTKKALKAATAAGERVEVFQPGPFGGSAQTSGTVGLEGPHFPAPHTWYATAVINDSVIVSVK